MFYMQIYKSNSGFSSSVHQNIFIKKTFKNLDLTAKAFSISVLSDRRLGGPLIGLNKVRFFFQIAPLILH